MLIDKDECKSGEYSCDPNARCVNTPGNYTCQCQSPYRADSDGKCTRKNLAIILIIYRQQTSEIPVLRIFFFLVGGPVIQRTKKQLSGNIPNFANPQ